jgi:hypothetical protein
VSAREARPGVCPIPPRVLVGGRPKRAPKRHDWVLFATFMPQPLPSQGGAPACTMRGQFCLSMGSVGLRWCARAGRLWVHRPRRMMC